jgi:hypothetical protein
MAATYAPKGVVFMQAITEGLDYEPSTIADVQGFAADVGANYTLLLDPREQAFGIFEEQRAWPFIIVVDARTMEIVQLKTGEPQDLARYVDDALTWVDSRPPKP